MKKLSILSLALCAMAAFTFTSCLDDDDDDNSLKPEQVQQCYAATRGSYTGILVYPRNPNSTLVTDNDTVNASWTINTDSTMVLQNVPSAAIATAFSDSTLKAEIAAQPNQNINCYIGYIRVEPVQWLVNPQYLTYNVNYNGAAHKLQVGFYYNNLYSYGQFNTTTRKMDVQIVVASAWIDGKYDNTLIRRPIGMRFHN